MKCSYSVKFYNKVQSLPRLTLHLRNMECDSVARDALVLGVFIALVDEIFCVDVAASTLSSVVWMAGRDEEMAEGTDFKGHVRKCIVNVLVTNDAKNYHSF